MSYAGTLTSSEEAAASNGTMRAVDAWLASHPSAAVAAVGEDGRPVPMPDDVPLGPGHHVDDRSLLSLVVPEDTAKVVTAFHEALRRGVAAVPVRLADEAAGPATVHYIDMRAAHGVVLRAVLPADSAPEDAEAGPPPSAAPPRLATLRKDQLSRITWIDEAITTLLGWTEEEVLGRPTLELIHPDDQPRAIDNWMAFIAAGTRHAVRLRYRSAAGGWLWLETSNEMVELADGDRQIFCQMLDVSDEMAAAEALRHNEQLLRRITETVPVGLAQIAPDRNVVFLNPTLQRLLVEHGFDSPAELMSDLPAAEAAAIGAAMDDCIDAAIDSDVDVRLPAHGATPVRVCRVALRSLTDDGRTLGALLCVIDVTELKLQAATDPLTGLHNRTSIVDQLHAALERGAAGVVFIDLDGFKSINDRFGHELGDVALGRAAAALRAAVRAGDAVGRLGGDEFLVVCPDIAGPSLLLEVTRRLVDALARCRAGGVEGLTLRASAGAAWVEAGSVTAEVAIARADTAMYAAKRSGTGPVLWPPHRGSPGAGAGYPSARR